MDCVKEIVKAVLIACMMTCGLLATAMPDAEIEYAATLELNASNGPTAPYMIGSWRNGINPYKSGALLDLEAYKILDSTRRFDWDAGMEFVTGFADGITYSRYSEETKSWGSNRMSPSAFHIQQLYGSIKYRSLYLLAGMKNNKSGLLDDALTSGDLIRSNNARPIPGVEFGFIDFQNIPFTNGWLQIEGLINYGKFMDNGYAEAQYNYYAWLLALDTYYTYKRCYFRTKPSQPFSITIGMQSAGQFGGRSDYYAFGKLTKTENRGFKFVDLWKMFIPLSDNGESWIVGNSIGSWDFKARYRFINNSELSFAFQWPFEDGSGIGRRNGWDGLWGLYYRKNELAPISGFSVEYLTFCNQSGPLHWAPNDRPGTDISNAATGGDNLYNSDMYGAYDNFGMSIGSPFLKSPLYNSDGHPAYLNTRARGFHACITGSVSYDIDYRLMLSYQKAWGNGRLPRATPLHDTSMMFELLWYADQIIPGLSVSLKAAFDDGNLRGNNFGALLSVKYNGKLTFR